jgi:hypothetical protein
MLQYRIPGKAQWWEPRIHAVEPGLQSRAAREGLFSSGFSRGVWLSGLFSGSLAARAGGQAITSTLTDKQSEVQLALRYTF